MERTSAGPGQSLPRATRMMHAPAAISLDIVLEILYTPGTRHVESTSSGT
jgi:hypothetical protein